MTAISNATTAKAGLRAAGLLLMGASGLALAAPLAANELLFTTGKTVPETGQRTGQTSGLTQIALTGGGVVSIVDAADYRINADGSVDLYEGTVTVAAGPAGEVVVRMPDGVEGRVGGQGSAGNFSARNGGEASGHALTGSVRIGRAGAFERFGAGAMWRAEGARGVRRVIANGAQAQPDAPDAASGNAPSVVAMGSGAGPVAAALNGIPAGFGDQLAAAGASSDILAAARRIEGVAGNPLLDTFPSGDLALLVAAAAQLEGAYGAAPFPAAQADIIRAYLRFLAGGGAGSAFLASYSRFAADYLDLIRSGGLPSTFAAAGPQDVDAWLAYIGRTGAISGLAARDRVLADAYLAFLASGGNRDAFARSFTDLTIAYFAFVRGGGDPVAFAGANAATLAQTIAFLRDSGLAVQLTAADRALIDAYLANGGLAFAGQYRAAFADYSAFLASGRRPSEYAAVSQETLRVWLETLASTGLFASVLGERAGFYTDYLAHLRAGGTADGFARLPANIFAGYAVELDAYFAFLAGGRLPSEFTAADIATLQSFVLELQAAGALDRFLGDRAAFFADYAAFVAGGGSVDTFERLPANIFAGYAANLRAYFDFLAAGGVPSGYTLLTPDQIRAYIAALEAAGATGRFLGDASGFWRDFAIYLAGGGNPDLFAGLPVPPDFPGFAAALNAYAVFLQGGGLPSAYTAQDLAALRAYIDALVRAGQIETLLGANAGLLSGYFAYLAGGGTPDGFAGLPVYARYTSALNAYFAFLQGGGLPSGYAALDADTIAAYLAALARLQGGLAAIAGLDPFFAEYFTFIIGGGNPDLFAGLPINSGGGGPTPPALLPQLAGAQFLRSFPGGAAITSGTTATVTDSGQITNVTIGADSLPLPGGITGPYNQRGLELKAAGRFGNAVAFTSYRDPNPARGPNYVTHIIAGVPTAVLPQTGTVAYRLVGGAAPTEQYLASGTEGYFTGNLGVAFGQAQPLVGFDFTVVSGGTTYASGTPGGALDPLNNGMLFGSTGRFTGSFAASATAGTGCTRANACASTVIGSFFGENASHVGLVYALNDTSVTNAPRLISGSAIFGTAGTALPGLGTAPVTGGGGGTVTAPPYSGTVQGLRVLTTRFGIGSSSIQTYTGSTATFDANGNIVTYTNSVGSTAGSGQPLADANAEAGSIDGAVAWARFLDPANAAAPGQVANTGVHTILGAPAANLPTVGTVTYTMIGGTRPTTNQGTAAPGSFSGALAVDFGARRVGVDFNVAIADRAWRVATAGGAANPSNGGLGFGGGGTTFFGTPTVTGLNAASCTAGCSGDVIGAFFGAGGAHAGAGYRVVDGSLVVRGLGVFAAPGAAGTPTPAVGGVSPAASAAQDWGRWTTPAATGPGAPAAALAALAPATGVGAESAAAAAMIDPADRDGAMRQAERLMGGMISFGAAPGDAR